MSDGSRQASRSSFHFIAGLSTGMLSAALLQPVDLLKTRVQQPGFVTLSATLRGIVSGPNAVRGLWTGTVPSILRTGFGSAFYFTILNGLRQQVSRRPLVGISSPSAAGEEFNVSSSALPKLSNSANLATGAVARVIAGFITMPITVIKVRFESSYYDYKSIKGAATSILRQEGIMGLFSGYGATAMRDAPYAGLYVLFYERMKHLLADISPSSLEIERMNMTKSASINFVSGLVGAGLATALTNPFDAIKTRLQLSPAQYGNMAEAARIMWRQNGPRSFFDGLTLRMTRKAISSALVWTLYEELVRKAEFYGT